MPQLTSIVDTSNKVPRAFVRVALGAGPRSPGSSAMKILLIGSKTSTGTAAVTTKYQIAGPDDALGGIKVAMRFGPDLTVAG